MPATRSCYKGVCVCVRCTWLGLRCTFLTYVRARTVVILSSLHVPVTYIPERTADDLVNYFVPTTILRNMTPRLSQH